MSIFVKKNDYNKEIIKFLKNVLGIRPKNLDIYKMAFTHSSASSKNAVSNALNNERLEYLGDAVINTVVADYLFKKFPLHPEGQLTEMRSKIVCRDHLNKLSRKMGLTDFVVIEPKCNPKSIDGDAFEALIGALYLDKGYNKTKDIIINKLILTFMDLDSLFQEENNFKSKLINWAQKKNYKIRFENHEIDNPKGRKLFISQCYLNNELVAEAEDFKVKKADQFAAEKVWKQLQKKIENG
ncbi:MAG: ribonuclease III [Bacteroidales bacterium]|nr:ribonuclease III [Bacteroidales bacterium]